MNSTYLWGLKQAFKVKNPRSFNYYDQRKQRKQAKKKLSAVQQAGRWSHDMDDDLFSSVCEMLTSKDRRDKVMALEIVLNSKMNMNHMNYFIQNHNQIILNGVPEDIDYSSYWSGPSASFASSLPNQII